MLSALGSFNGAMVAHSRGKFSISGWIAQNARRPGCSFTGFNSGSIAVVVLCYLSVAWWQLGLVC